VVAVLAVVAVWADWARYDLLGRIVNDGSYTIAEATTSDNRQSTIALLQIGALVFGAIFFIRWFLAGSELEWRSRATPPTDCESRRRPTSSVTRSTLWPRFSRSQSSFGSARDRRSGAAKRAVSAPA